MLEVSSSHFNHAHTNRRTNLYMHEPEGSFSCSGNENIEPRSKKPIEDLYLYGESCGTENASLDNCAERARDLAVRRQFRDVDSIPLFVSTPTSEDAREHQDTSIAYLQKKARRISRMYLDRANNPFEALEVEQPLLEYLVRHGALTSDASDMILCTEKHKQRGLLLTELGLPSFNEVSARPSDPLTLPSTTGFALLLNALRHTGHHSLASHLDCGRRIRPSPGLQSIEDSERGASSLIHRRRGQLSLQIRLDAIKVDPVVYDRLLQPLLNLTSSTSLSCEYRNTPLTRSKPVNPMLPSFVEDLAVNSAASTCESSSARWPRTQTPFWIDQNEPLQPNPELYSWPLSVTTVELPPNNTTPEKSVGCFHKLFCLFHPLRKYKAKKQSRLTATATEPQPTLIQSHTVDVTDMSLTRFRRPLGPVDGAGDGPVIAPQNDRLVEAKLALLDTKCFEFCQVVLDSSLPLHDALVKYFEQSSGVLVLDCAINSPTYTSVERSTIATNTVTALCVTVVATRPDLVTRLIDACQLCQNPSSEFPQSDPSGGSRLSTDLQKILKEANICSVLCVQDFRLSVSLDASEVSKALEELADLVE
ncbi:hypothetical protein FGIG_00982 [Fasciola gigantica]|uniref:Uncharacterized protein n=1 Tax=Fasciola gigantica TaxID=46835 RepID=A0A504YBA5_FASGI|nr:hypothetical protein FGIG_00982 [Fasciola gigantica]